MVPRTDRHFQGDLASHLSVCTAKHYDPERPLIEARLTPEYKTSSRSGIVEPRKQDMHKYQRWIDTFQAGDAELVHTGWSLESGGVADTDEYELADLMAWWTEYVASGDAEADANVIDL